MTARRANAGLDRPHPDLSFTLLSWQVGEWPARQQDMFTAGVDLMTARYAQFGLGELLPTDRVWIGVHSTRAAAWGGFHRPDQGYRHVQLGAVVTRYGDLAAEGGSLDLVVLDLLRAYAHDTLHYGSHRCYELRERQIVRTWYGVNPRDWQGCSYSPPDRTGAVSTRNLGTIMEGAGDREARTITRRVADRYGVTEPTAPVDRYEWLDITGHLTPDDTARLADCRQLAEITPHVGAAFYLHALGSYERSIGARYAAFLDEIGGDAPGRLHDLILTAMLSGRLGDLGDWLDQHHGEGAFRRLFRSPTYQGPDPQ